MFASYTLYIFNKIQNSLAAIQQSFPCQYDFHFINNDNGQIGEQICHLCYPDSSFCLEAPVLDTRHMDMDI